MKSKKIYNKVFKKKNNKKIKSHKNHQRNSIKMILNQKNKWKQKIVQIQTKTMTFKMIITIFNNRTIQNQIRRKMICKKMKGMLTKKVLTMKMIKKTAINRKKRNQSKKNLNRNSCFNIKNNNRLYKKI